MQKRAILYIRVSTDEQAEKGNSLRHQEIMLNKYCEFNKTEVAALYSEDYSAKTFERPEFKKLLNYAKANKNSIDYLYILKWDRFSRNVEESYRILSVFQKLNIKVVAIEQPIDYEIPEQKLMLAFYLASPQVENERRGLNTKAGMRRGLMDGRLMNNVPIGYKWARDEKNKPVVILSEKAELIRWALEQFSTGLYSKEQLRKELGNKGIRLGKSHIIRILGNVTYIGKLKVVAYKQEPEQIINGTHPAIVSEEVFRKVQYVLSGKKSSVKNSGTKVKEWMPLRGLLICSKCGKNLTGSKSKGKTAYYTYYHCQPGCTERFSTEQAHKDLESFLGNIKVAPEISDLYLKVSEDVWRKNERERLQELDKLKKEAEEKEKNLIALEDKYIRDEIGKDSYIRMKAFYSDGIKDITDKVFEINSYEKDFIKRLSEGVNILKDLDLYYKSAKVEAKQKILCSIFPEKMIYENNDYRTPKVNEVLLALNGFKEDYEALKTKRAVINDSSSLAVARRGIKPYPSDNH